MKQAKEESPNATNNKIRFFYVPKSTSTTPQDDVNARWVVCNPEDMLHFSTIGYFFGKQVNASTGFPVGLINSNWGGTPAEVWTPEEIITHDPDLLRAAEKLSPTAWWWPHIRGEAYNAMIYPLTQFSIAGAIWYQGESNVGTHFMYKRLFTSMIDSWRKAWGKTFPFYFVQIAPYTYGNKNIGALLRETQTKAAAFPNTGMVVISDLVPDTANIHPILKKEVAARLSNLALNKTYGYSQIVCESPLYASHKIEKDKIKIQFTNTNNGIVANGNEITCFEIAGADKIFYPAQAKIENNEVVVFNKNIKSPVAVRFAFNNTAIPNLFSKEGLPINLFRTDDWEMDRSEIKK